jgi:hypothetical protein
MIRSIMRARVPALIGLVVAGAQAGHLLAYALRFGAAAQQVQASGAHAYFPAFVKTALGGAALALLAALLVIGAARAVARGRRARPVAGRPPFVSLLATLFTLQLAWFMAQELTEALVAGLPAPGAEDLLLWGMLGQLPVALVGATAIVWLGRHVEAAIAELGAIAPASAPLLFTAPLALRPIALEDALATAHASRSRIVKRGPPTSFTFRPF